LAIFQAAPFAPLFFKIITLETETIPVKKGHQSDYFSNVQKAILALFFSFINTT
jgi:hypothetical protein